MKKYILLLQLMFTAAVFAQNPVRWTTQAIQTDTLKFDIIITAEIEEKWHLYATEMPEDGSTANRFYF